MRLGNYMTANAIGMAPHECYTIQAKDGSMLGIVEWYERWHQYVFDPEAGAVFSHDCLAELVRFIQEQNKGSKASCRHGWSGGCSEDGREDQ